MGEFLVGGDGEESLEGWGVGARAWGVVCGEHDNNKNITPNKTPPVQNALACSNALPWRDRWRIVL